MASCFEKCVIIVSNGVEYLLSLTEVYSDLFKLRIEKLGGGDEFFLKAALQPNANLSQILSTIGLKLEQFDLQAVLDKRVNSEVAPSEVLFNLLKEKAWDDTVAVHLGLKTELNNGEIALIVPTDNGVVIYTPLSVTKFLISQGVAIHLKRIVEFFDFGEQCIRVEEDEVGDLVKVLKSYIIRNF
ncbi:MAG: hypothetical protein ACRC80_31470 [Waterburya sp.]